MHSRLMSLTKKVIGTVKEIKVLEHRVGLTPSGVVELKKSGHTVLVETKCGEGSGFTDKDYKMAGAEIVNSAKEVFDTADIVVKVKEPQPEEIKMLRPDQTLFTYLHLAPDSDQTQGLLKSGATAIAYETVTGSDGSLPLLAPMSEVAGRLAVQKAAWCMEKQNGGRGMLLGGTTGTRKSLIMIVGAGIVGMAAARMAVGLGARVTLLDTNSASLRAAVEEFGVHSGVETLHSNHTTITETALHADVIIGAVLVTGARAPKLISKELVHRLRPGCIIVDVAIDQGGFTECSLPTTHAEPTYLAGETIMYAVTNMPGAVPRTSTFALTDATLPFLCELANKGPVKAMQENKGLYNGCNVYKGKLVNEAVAQSQEIDFTPLSTLL